MILSKEEICVHVCKKTRGIYMLYDENKNLIYIGKSKDVDYRLFGHYKNKNFEFSFYDVIIYDELITDEELSNIEKNLIKKHKPIFNVHYNKESNIRSINTRVRANVLKIDTFLKEKGV